MSQNREPLFEGGRKATLKGREHILGTAMLKSLCYLNAPASMASECAETPIKWVWLQGTCLLVS